MGKLILCAVASLIGGGVLAYESRVPQSIALGGSLGERFGLTVHGNFIKLVGTVHGF